MQNSISFFFPFASCDPPWNPNYCFLKTWNRASSEVFVFKGKILSPCWVLGATLGTVTWNQWASKLVPVHRWSLSHGSFHCYVECAQVLGPSPGPGYITFDFHPLIFAVLCANTEWGHVSVPWRGSEVTAGTAPVLTSCLHRQEPASIIYWNCCIAKPIYRSFEKGS